MRGLALALAACGSAPAAAPDASSAPTYARGMPFASPLPVSGDQFGAQVALSNDGRTLAIGVARDDSGTSGIAGIGHQDAPDAGAVYVFAFDDGAWRLQAFLKPDPVDSADQFGASIGLSATGDALAVGAPGEDGGVAGDPSDNSATGAGAAYVFRRRAGNWSQQAYLKAAFPDAEVGFGQAVALSSDGNTVAVGAPGDDGADNLTTDCGAAYVFGTDGTTWTQQGYLHAGAAAKNVDLASAVALSASGDALIVGAPRDGISHAGSALIFRRTAGAWALDAQLAAASPQANGAFGTSVAIAGLGGAVVVGAPREDSRGMMASGAAYAFAGDGWAQVARVEEPAPAVSDQLGMAVAISADGRWFAAGAPTNDAAAMDAGAVFGFALDGTPSARVDGTQAGAQLGASLALTSDGRGLAAGAPLADESQGAAFLYE